MGLIWCLATPSTEDREKGDGTNYSWSDYANKVVRLVLARHKRAERIICMNDAYVLKYSIKDSERMLRKKDIPNRNVYIKSEDKFPSKKDFNAFLGNSDNKIRFQAFLKTAFQSTALATSNEIIYCVVSSSSINLTTGKHLPEFSCSQAEADTAMFTVYSVLRSQAYTGAVVLDTEDTDNYVQAALSID